MAYTNKIKRKMKKIHRKKIKKMKAKARASRANKKK